jgi:hypothetical protein
MSNQSNKSNKRKATSQAAQSNKRAHVNIEKLTHFRQPTPKVMRERADKVEELQFINQMVKLFRKVDADAILSNQHRLFNMYNLENIVLNDGHSLLYTALTHIKSAKQMQAFLRLCTQLQWSQEFWDTFDRQMTWRCAQRDSMGRIEQTCEENNYSVINYVLELLCCCKTFVTKHANVLNSLLDFFVSKGFMYSKYYPEHTLETFDSKIARETRRLGVCMLQLFDVNTTTGEVTALLTFDFNYQLSAAQKRYLSEFDLCFADLTDYYKSLRIFRACGVPEQPFSLCVGTNKTNKIYTWLRAYEQEYNINNVDVLGNTVAHRLFQKFLPLRHMANSVFIQYLLEVHQFLISAPQIDMTQLNFAGYTAFDYLFQLLTAIIDSQFVLELASTSSNLFHGYVEVQGLPKTAQILIRFWYYLLGLFQFSVTPASVLLTEQSLRTVCFSLFEQFSFDLLVSPKSLTDMLKMLTYSAEIAIRCVRFNNQSRSATYTNFALPIQKVNLGVYFTYHTNGIMSDLRAQLKRMMTKYEQFFDASHEDKQTTIKTFDAKEFFVLRTFNNSARTLTHANIKVDQQTRGIFEFYPSIDTENVKPFLAIADKQFGSWCRTGANFAYFMFQGLVLGIDVQRLRNWCALQDNIARFVHARKYYIDKSPERMNQTLEEAHIKQQSYFTSTQSRSQKFKVVMCKDLFSHILSFLF